MATIFRPVVVTRVAKRRLVGEVSVASNLLLTLLAVTAAAPFSQSDWPNPRPRAERQDVQQAPNLLTTTLAPADATRTRTPTFTWRVAARRPADVGVIPNLLTTTLAPAAQAPFAQNEWRNPERRKRGQVDVAPNLLASTLAAAPFKQLDWTSPVWRVAQQAIEFQNLFGSILAPADPFKQVDWTTPVWRVSQQAGDFQNLLTTTLAPAPVAAAQTTARTQAGGPRKPYPGQRQARRLQGDGDGEAVYSRDLILPDVDVDVESGEVTTRARLDETLPGDEADGGEGIVARQGFGIVKRGAVQEIISEQGEFARERSETEKAMTQEEEDRRIRLILLSH